MLYQDNQQRTSQPYQPIYHQEELAPVLKVSDWILMLIVASIPVLNVIMYIVWSMESGTNPNKANWAKASLLIVGIQIVLGIFLMGAFMGAVSHFVSGMGNLNSLSLP